VRVGEGTGVRVEPGSEDFDVLRLAAAGVRTLRGRLAGLDPPAHLGESDGQAGVFGPQGDGPAQVLLGMMQPARILRLQQAEQGEIVGLGRGAHRLAQELDGGVELLGGGEATRPVVQPLRLFGPRHRRSRRRPQVRLLAVVALAPLRIGERQIGLGDPFEEDFEDPFPADQVEALRIVRMDQAGRPLVALVHFQSRRDHLDAEQIVEAALPHPAQQRRHPLPVHRRSELHRALDEADGNAAREETELFLRNTTTGRHRKIVTRPLKHTGGTRAGTQCSREIRPPGGGM
jgi:hypothetical protein